MELVIIGEAKIVFVSVNIPKEPIYAGNVCCFCANSFNLSTHTFSSTSLKQANVMCGLVFHSRYLVLSFSSAILSA